MGELYQDKSVDSIKNSIQKKWEQTDGIVRDDYEIYKASLITLDSYIDEVKKSGKEKWGPWALEEFSKLRSTLLAEMNKMTSMKIFNQEKALIQDLANKIDNAEKLVLERLAMSRSKSKLVELQKEMAGKYFTVQSDNSLLFTKDVNKPKIHEVLDQIIKDKKETYIIDYSGCTNESIKNKMLSLTGTENGQCYLSYDENSKTYLLKGNKDGKQVTLQQRALIWEGVSVIPEFVYKQKARNKQFLINKSTIENLKNKSNIDSSKTLSDLERDDHWGPILTDLKKLGGDLYQKLLKESQKDPQYIRRFLSESEKRLDEIVIYAKQHKWNFHAEPISKLNLSAGLMEVHLISDTAEKDIPFFADDTKLGKEVYNWIDSSYESEYLSFLTARLSKKVDNFSLLDKKEQVIQAGIDKNDTSKKYTDQEKENINQGLSSFSMMLKNIKDENGDTWGNDDRKIVDMINFVDNAIYSIRNITTLTENILKNTIVNPLYEKRNRFNFSNKNQKIFNELISGDKDKIRESIRSLGQSLTILGNTHTSYLKDEIINEENLVLRNTDINTCFQNISSKLKFNKEDGFDKEPQKSLIDSLYEAKGGLELKNILQKNNLLPSDIILSDNLEEVINKCTDLYNQLIARKNTEDNLGRDVFIEDFQKNQEIKKIAIETKENKTEEDLLELQTILWLENNPQVLQACIDNSLSIVKQQIKYGDMDQLIKGSLGHLLIDISGGLQSGTGSDIYNDITGQGFWNLSDENVKFVGEMGKMILEEVAFTIAVLALTATTGVGGVALIGARIALKTASVGGKLNKIRSAKRMIAIAQNVGKSLVKTEKIIKRIDAIKDIKKLEKQISNTYEVSKIVKTVDKIEDGSRIVKAVDKVDDISKSKNLLIKTKNYVDKINPIQRKTIFADLDRVITRGALHQVLAKTWRGELDVDTETWIKDVLKSSGMYGVLGIVGRSAQTGILAKLFVNNPSGLKISQICAEEGLMFGSDMGVDVVMDSNPMPTMQEIAQNIGIGLGAELLPRVGGRIKTMRIGKDYIDINGRALKPAELLDEIDSEIKVKKVSKEKSYNNNKPKEDYKTPEEIHTKIGELKKEIDIIKGNGKYAEPIDILENGILLLKAKKNKNANVENQIYVREIELNSRKQEIAKLENEITDLNLSLRKFENNAQDNNDIGNGKLENARKNIDKAKSFEDLNKEIDNLGEFIADNNQKYKPNMIKDIINQVRLGTKTIDFVPKEAGLRNKVKELLSFVKIYDSKVNVSNILKNKKTPDYTIDALKIDDFKPIKSLEIDGKVFHFSKIANDGKGGRDIALGYVEVDGKMELLMFYKSNSDGGRRLNSPDANQSLSKGLSEEGYGYRSYTRETKPHESICSLLDVLPRTESDGLYNEYRSIRSKYKGFSGNTQRIKDYIIDIKKQDEKIDILVKGDYENSIYLNGEISRGGQIYGDKQKSIDVDRIKNIKYPDGFVPDFENSFLREYASDHTIFGKTKIQVFEGKLKVSNGKDMKVEWHMASDKEGRVWVDKIIPENTKISNWGIYDKVTDFGVFDLKPADYDIRSGSNQVARIPDGYKVMLGGKNSDYTDITPFLDNLKPIEMYRMYSKIERKVLV